MKLNELNEQQQMEQLRKLLENKYLFEAYRWERHKNQHLSFDIEWIKEYVVKSDWNFLV